MLTKPPGRNNGVGTPEKSAKDEEQGTDKM
jgi:hypothetical protein